MTHILHNAFLSTLGNQPERQCERTAETPVTTAIRAVLNADECGDWIERSMGLGGAAIIHHEGINSDA